MDDYIIIGAYPNNSYCQDFLLENLKSLSGKFKICLSTHYPCDPAILNYVDYFIYDKNNYMFKRLAGTSWNFFGNWGFVSQPKECRIDHSLSVVYQIYNFLPLLKSRGVENFYYIEGDCIFGDTSEIDRLKQLVKKEVVDKNKKFFIFEEGGYISMTVFYSNIDFFKKLIPFFKNTDEYAKDFLLDFYYEQRVASELKLEKHREQVCLVKSRPDLFFKDFIFDLNNVIEGDGEHPLLDALKEKDGSDIYLMYRPKKQEKVVFKLNDKFWREEDVKQGLSMYVKIPLDDNILNTFKVSYNNLEYYFDKETILTNSVSHIYFK